MGLNQLLEILNNISFENNNNLVDQKIITGVKLYGNKISFVIDCNILPQDKAINLQALCTAKLAEYSKDLAVNIILTGHKNTSKSDKYKLPNIKEVIIVASGKGGVGKSTISALIAGGLNLHNKKVGLLDADIYGPSIGNMSGINKIKAELSNNKLNPVEVNGIKTISMSYLFEDGQAAIWRGPMISKVLYQLFHLTNWGELDYLIIDTPPGTGDIHLSLLQQYVIDKVLFVTIPNKICLVDTLRSIDLYKKLNIPILGIIKNNIIPYQDKEIDKIISEHNVNVIGELDFDEQITHYCDKGKILQTNIYINQKIAPIIEKSFF